MCKSAAQSAAAVPSRAALRDQKKAQQSCSRACCCRRSRSSLSACCSTRSGSSSRRDGRAQLRAAQKAADGQPEVPVVPGGAAGRGDDDRRLGQGRVLAGAGLHQGAGGLRAAGGAPDLHLPRLRVVRLHRPRRRPQALEEDDAPAAAAALEPHAGVGRCDPAHQDQVLDAAAQRRVRARLLLRCELLQSLKHHQATTPTAGTSSPRQCSTRARPTARWPRTRRRPTCGWSRTTRRGARRCTTTTRCGARSTAASTSRRATRPSLSRTTASSSRRTRSPPSSTPPRPSPSSTST